MAEENAPSRKYLSAASPDAVRRVLKAASTYRAMERISSPKNTMIRSLAWAMRMAPDAETRARTWYSGPSIPSRRRYPSPTRAEMAMADDTTTATNTLKPSITTARSTVVYGVDSAYHCHSDTARAARLMTTVPAVATGTR